MPKEVKNLQDIADKQSSALAKTASVEINRIHEDLKSSVKKEVLPEGVFKEYFLAYFMNPEQHKDSPLLSKWLELSGGPYNEVDILDDTSGKVLYTVPSIMVRPNVDFKAMAGYNFGHIASTYFMKKNITEAQATNYLNTALAGIPEHIQVDARRHIAMWATIFERYNNVSNSKKPTVDKNSRAVDLGIFER